MGVQVTDWDKAYANADSIPDAALFIERWPEKARHFRKQVPGKIDISYGQGERQKMDLFRSASGQGGLFVFVHGGYWYRFDKSYWSHLASGPLKHGWQVAIPSYTLTPQSRVRDITKEIATAINEAAKYFDGPIVLCGHSAGGHLVTRQVCADSRLDDKILSRIKRVISVSGVHDLRPIRKLTLNETIGIDEEEAQTESPALLNPKLELPVDCVAGADELPEFRRQNTLLANIWRGLGCETSCHEIENTHHFNVIEDLENSEGLICRLANQSL